MTDLVVALVSHNELTTRGEEVLRRTLDSLARSLDHLARQKPGVDAYVACCDDASADATPDYIERYFKGRDWFRLVRNRTHRYIGFSRNVAAAQFDTELVCLLDADDEYRESHLQVCADVMEKSFDPQGRKFAAASTAAEFNPALHPGWAGQVSQVIPITKVIRRTAWEFVEGQPMQEVYRRTTCDDQFLQDKLFYFFGLLLVPEVTVRYWLYPGSALDSQLAKFQRPPEEYRPGTEGDPTWQELQRLREQNEITFVNYLQAKLDHMGWRERLQGFVMRDPLPDYEETVRPRPVAVAAEAGARPAAVHSVLVPAAPGELVDKITILEIKSERIKDPDKLRAVRLELAALEAARDRALEPSARLRELMAELKQVNEALWQIEDDIRGCERDADFGPRFVELARSVYHQNDRRAVVKRRINELFGSDIREEKEYTSYRREHEGGPPAD
jgi:glycosyltransferase involved in cell wall biosynthesis